MPAEKAFLDTNVLVYAFSVNDPKKPVAETLIIQGGLVGVQALNEFVNVERHKMREPWPAVLHWLQIIAKLCPPPVPLDASTHMRGLQITQDTGYHIYDSMMLAAAFQASCTVFYSEDMQHGQVIDGLTIRNPFQPKSRRR